MTPAEKEKHIWEGWRVIDFIEELEPSFNQIMNNRSWHKPFTGEGELKEWCKDNQPYYKKHIPQVYKHFKNRMKEYKRV